MMPRTKLLNHLNQYLNPERFEDAAPNGLQIEGSATIKYILTALSASQKAIQEAILRGADTLLVHHGYFWKKEPLTITGIKKERIGALLRNNINLIAYHLPLDAHLDIGNNAMLAKTLDWTVTHQCGEQGLLWCGTVLPTKADDFVHQISQTLGQSAVILGSENRMIKNIAWSTGAAQHSFEEAIALGVDAFITGEVSEYNNFLAQESGVLFIAAGHTATERYGIRALGDWISQTTAIKVEHSTQHNPI